MEKTARAAVWFLWLAGLSRGSWAQKTLTPEEREDLERVKTQTVVYSVAGMNRVRLKNDLTYKTDGSLELRMDVYMPATDASGKRLPIVFFIHGGVGPSYPIRPKDWGSYRSWGRLAAASGMIGVTFNHRVGYPDPNLVQGSADVEDAIEFIRRRSSEFSADPDRIALAAYSAGGPMLAPRIRDPKPWLRCLVAFYSFLDLRQSPLHRKYLSDERIREFSAAVALSESTAKVPPIFIARAGHDQIPDLQPGLDRFVSEAIARNLDLTFVNQPDGEHGFDIGRPDPRSREIVREALEFLRRHLN